MKVNLPNQITIGRLVLAVIFVILLSQYDHRSASPSILDWCAALFVVAALSDALDGYLARKQNQITSFGRILDPLADKVLVCGAFAFFAGCGFVDGEGGNVTQVVPWMVVLIFSRELLVTGLRGFSESGGESYGASVFGKAKMVIQSVTVPVVLVSVAHGSPLLDRGRVILIWLTVAATTISLVVYLIRSKAILAETSRR